MKLILLFVCIVPMLAYAFLEFHYDGGLGCSESWHFIPEDQLAEVNGQEQDIIKSELFYYDPKITGSYDSPRSGAMTKLESSVRFNYRRTLKEPLTVSMTLKSDEHEYLPIKADVWAHDKDIAKFDKDASEFIVIRDGAFRVDYYFDYNILNYRSIDQTIRIGTGTESTNELVISRTLIRSRKTINCIFG